MSKANIVTIEHLEVKRSEIEKIKKAFNVTDNSEAVRRALDMASGKKVMHCRQHHHASILNPRQTHLLNSLCVYQSS